MAHLDLRPANIFLTTAASYRQMEARDPQRLQLLVAQGYNPVAGSSGGGGVGGGERPLFASILNAASLQSHQGGSGSSSSNNNSGGGTSNVKPDNEFAAYDVRGEVERQLVRRHYEIRMGDLGHCCRVDEKSAIQVRRNFCFMSYCKSVVSLHF